MSTADITRSPTRSKRWRNPILPGTHPDPTVARVGEHYYLTTSTFEYFPALPMFRSTDLEHWEPIGHAIDRVDQIDLSTVASSHGVFAPTLRHHDDRWYLICTLVGGTRRQGNFILTADDPAGDWSDPIWLDDAPGIDPSLFFAEDGRAWYCGTQLVERDWPEQTAVWLQELDLTKMALTGPRYELWSGALTSARWAEGPHLYHRAGWYYLLASEGGTEFHHAASVARSRTVTGPYEGYAGNPVITHRHLGHSAEVQNVGHPDLVQRTDGGWAAVLLATRPHDGRSANLGRETFVVDVEWQDDWPVFAPGVGRVEVGNTRTIDGPPPLSEWNQVRTGAHSFWSLTADGSTATLSRTGCPLEAIGTPSLIGVRQAHPRSSLAALVPEGGALVARQSEDALLVVAVQESRVVIRARHRGVWLDVEEVEAHGALADIAIDAADGVYRVRVNGSNVANVAGHYLSSESAGGFIGAWLCLAVTGEGEDDVSFHRIRYTGSG